MYDSDKMIYSARADGRNPPPLQNFVELYFTLMQLDLNTSLRPLFSVLGRFLSKSMREGAKKFVKSEKPVIQADTHAYIQ